MFSTCRRRPHAWNTLQLGKTTANNSTIQHWDPWSQSKPTRDLVPILTTFQESWRQESEGSGFPEILEAFHARHWKWRHTKSLWVECSQMHFTWFFAGLDSSHFLSPVFCPIYIACLHIEPWLEHRICYASTLLLWSPSALSIRTSSLKCFGNAYFYFFSNTKTIQQEDKSLVPLNSRCLWHNTLTNKEGTHNCAKITM